jgi:hypothetical protein
MSTLLKECKCPLIRYAYDAYYPLLVESNVMQIPVGVLVE